MSQGLVTAAYIIAAVLFILALAGLSKQETAKRGNWYGIAGMTIALIATVFGPHFQVSAVVLIVIAMIIGGLFGAFRLAMKVEMTQMPQMVALLHSFVGLGAVLVGINSFIIADHNIEVEARDPRRGNAHHYLQGRYVQAGMREEHEHPEGEDR